MATKSRWGHECKQHELGKKKRLTNQRDVDSETHPLLNGAAGPMVNRGATGALFCFYLAYFFAQQSQLTVWTKRLNIQRLNNLSLADRENIHFTATYESVYLRKQRQTLERGWDEVRRRKKKTKQNQKTTQQHSAENKASEKKETIIKHDAVCISTVPPSDFAVTWGGCFCLFLVFFFFPLLKLFDSTVTMKWNNSFCVSGFVWLCFLHFPCAYLTISSLMFVLFSFVAVS